MGRENGSKRPRAEEQKQSKRTFNLVAASFYAFALSSPVAKSRPSRCPCGRAPRGCPLRKHPVWHGPCKTSRASSRTSQAPVLHDPKKIQSFAKTNAFAHT